MYTNAPTLLSENLILRGPEARDQEPVIAFLQDEDRAAGFGALPNRGDAWRWFALNVGHWAMHGYGYFMIETKSGETAGISGIWNPKDGQNPRWAGSCLTGLKGAALPMRLLVACAAGPMKIWDLKQSPAISFRATPVPSVWPNGWVPFTSAPIKIHIWARTCCFVIQALQRWRHDPKHRRDTDVIPTQYRRSKLGEILRCQMP